MLHIALENDASIIPKTEDGAQCNSEQKAEQLPQQHATHYKHPDVDGGWAFVVLAAMFGSFFINSGKNVFTSYIGLASCLLT